MKARELFRFVLLDRTSNALETLPIEVVEVSKTSKGKRKPRKGAEKISTKKDVEPTKPNRVVDNVILNANRLLGIVLVLSFISIIVFAITGKSDQLPSVVSYTFSTTLGYFGGIIVNYMDKASNQSGASG